ncbi:hypothetical protein ES703_31831 [subsurface metagenome]
MSLPPGIDKSTLTQLGLSGVHPFALDEEILRQLGYLCLDCDSRKIVYYISVPKPPAFDKGAYCYRCLFNRCLRSGMLPYPIPQDLLDALRHDIKAAREHAIKKFHGG